MDCEIVRELYAAALASGDPGPAELDGHLSACPACREGSSKLAATWAALAALPVVEPSPAVRRQLRRRVRRVVVRQGLVSLERWQQAALAGVMAFVVSVFLSLVLPYDTVVALCRDLVPRLLPTSLAYVLAGVLYGLAPMAVGAAVQARGTGLPGLLGGLEASLVFLIVLLPYVVVRCSEFPVALLAGFLVGIAAGGVAGAAAGVRVTRRQGWA